jgi:hypothetical protein
MRRLLLIGAMLLGLLSPALAVDSSVPALTAASAIAGTDLFYCIQTGGTVDRKCTSAQIATYVYSLANGDCTISGVGAVVCTKTSGVAFSALATTVPGTGVATALGVALSGAGGVTSTIAGGTAVLGTGAIASAACAAAVTVVATNVATTDVVTASFNSDPTAVTGYIPLTTGMLTIIGYPTAGNVNFKVCNNTSGSITPGAVTLNWRVTR